MSTYHDIYLKAFLPEFVYVCDPCHFCHLFVLLWGVLVVSMLSFAFSVMVLRFLLDFVYLCLLQPEFCHFIPRSRRINKTRALHSMKVDCIQYHMAITAFVVPFSQIFDL